MIRALLLALALTLAGCGQQPAADNQAVEAKPAAATAPLPDTVRVRLDTEAGPIVLALDVKHAPITATNFVRYVEQHRFDGTFFYRAARTKGANGRGFVQGGIRHSARKALPPIAHEPTGKTGLHHVDGAVSMARAEPVGAMGDFFIIVGGAMPDMDAHGSEPGFAVFGRVVEGMDVVRKILAEPTVANAGRGPMKGQMLEKPVRIVSAARVD
ncbi:MAG: peptidylprolyl isomerase [Allosphingosinicella sp.]